MIKEKFLELKKAIEQIKQNTYDTIHNTRRFNHNKRKTTDKRRTDTKEGNILCQTKNKNYRKPIMQTLRQPESGPIT